jgi:hypothetical protein
MEAISASRELRILTLAARAASIALRAVDACREWRAEMKGDAAEKKEINEERKELLRQATRLDPP